MKCSHVVAAFLSSAATGLAAPTTANSSLIPRDYGNFGQSCKEAHLFGRIINGETLIGLCASCYDDTSDSWKSSWLNLDGCFGNDRGQLVSPGGQFQQSCDKNSMVLYSHYWIGTNWFKASCASAAGEYYDAYYHLEKNVANRLGRLVCDVDFHAEWIDTCVQ